MGKICIEPMYGAIMGVVHKLHILPLFLCYYYELLGYFKQRKIVYLNENLTEVISFSPMLKDGGAGNTGGGSETEGTVVVSREGAGQESE